MDIRCNLTIYHNFIIEYTKDGTGARMASDKTDTTKIYREELQLSQKMTLKEFTELASDRIKNAFGIDLKSYNTENGGKGTSMHLDCSVDVEGLEKRDQYTTMNIPNEGSWEAAKHLMDGAKGEAKLNFSFAVERFKFLERMVLQWIGV